jgi:pimeloyl-ACP methyl ester carboxylesterase
MSLPRITFRRLTAIALMVAIPVAIWQYDERQLWESRRVSGLHQLQSHVLFDYCRILDASGDVVFRGSNQACRAGLADLAGDGSRLAKDRHLVLLLHGLGRSPALFAEMESLLRAQGYRAFALAYPTLRKNINGHADNLTALLNELEGVERVSFVTHSLGGLVVRSTLGRNVAWQKRMRVARIVMIAPPNQGSRLARYLGEWRLFGFILGPAAEEIAAGAGPDLPDLTGYEFGIIAGGKNAEGFNPWLPGDDDAIVTLEETRLSGARDFLRLEATHTFLPQNENAIRASLNFLKHGRFASEPLSENSLTVPEEGRT